jgi:hypothetical protein
VVLVHESAEDSFAVDPVLEKVDRFGWPGVGLSRCELAEGTVRPGVGVWFQNETGSVSGPAASGPTGRFSTDSVLISIGGRGTNFAAMTTGGSAPAHLCRSNTRLIG